MKINNRTKQMNGYMKDHIDVVDTLARLGNNTQLYQRVLIAYLEDNNCNNYFAELECKNYKKAYQYAHTVKGLASNLGFIKLEQLGKESAGFLKQGNVRKALHIAPLLKEEQNIIVEMVKDLVSNGDF